MLTVSGVLYFCHTCGSTDPKGNWELDIALNPTCHMCAKRDKRRGIFQRRCMDVKLGRKHTEEEKLRVSMTSKGKHKTRLREQLLKLWSNPEHRERMSAIRKGKPLPITEAGRRSLIESKKGSKNPSWKGGVSDLRKLIRHLPEYEKWRRAVFERDNYTCTGCNTRTRDLQADHIKPFALILLQNNIKTVEDARTCMELWDVNNGRTCCLACHRETETYGHKLKPLLVIKN